MNIQCQLKIAALNMMESKMIICNTYVKLLMNYTKHTNIKVICNDDQPVLLVITQINQSDDGNGSLISNDSAHMVSYNLFINDVRYNNASLNIQPNVDNSIRINVNLAVNTGQYQDSLIFTINY